MYQKIQNRLSWWAYQQQVRQRLRAWDRLGGGLHAAAKIQDSMLLTRPAFAPLAPDDPIFRDPRLGLTGPDDPWTDGLEYVYHLRRPAFIEPEFGYVIAEPAVLIPELVAWSRQARFHDRMKYFSGVPCLESYDDARQGRTPVREEPIVISLRHAHDANYGHCLIQIMPTLMLLDECGVSPDIPLVVAPRLGHQPFFQEIIRRGSLARRRWIVQEDTYIHAQEILFAVTEWPSPALLGRLLDAMDAPQPDRQSQNRLFLLRRNNRRIRNIDALMPVLAEFGFEAISPEDYTIAEQMAVFSGAGVVCGTLGAALTNVIFRRDAPLHLLEIDPLTQKNDLFFSKLAKTCGYAYDFLSCEEPLDRRAGDDFSVNAERFRAFLQAALG